MKIKQFNSLEEIKKYYDENINTYIFKEKDEELLIDLVVFNFDLDIDANIIARNIEARNINAYDINACNINAYEINVQDIKVLDIKAYNIYAYNINAYNINAYNIKVGNIYALDINARNIYANDIDYYAVCFAHHNIICKTIKGRRNNCKHFSLDGEITIKKD